MARAVSPTEPLPVNAKSAVKVFRNEILASLIRYYSQHPGGTQTDAVHAIGSAQSIISRGIADLVDEGVLIQTSEGGVGQHRTYIVDLERFDTLLDALSRYGRGQDPDPPSSQPHDTPPEIRF